MELPCAEQVLVRSAGVSNQRDACPIRSIRACGRRDNERAADSGAQTERRTDAGSLDSG
jgi:hypothetical protein